MNRPAIFLVVLLALIVQSCASRTVAPDPEVQPERPRLVDLDLASYQTVDNKVDTAINMQLAIETFRELLEISKGMPEQDYSQTLYSLADLELEYGIELMLSEDDLKATQGERYISSAIDSYKSHQDNYPKNTNGDSILYQMIRAYALLNDLKAMKQSMFQLVKEFHQSKFAPEIFYRLGELHFVDAEYQKAEQAYQVITTQYMNTVFFDKARYKLGWSQFKQEYYDRALSTFIEIIDSFWEGSMIDTASINPALKSFELNFLEDVLGIVSISLILSENEKPIVNMFKRLGKREYAPLLYQDLAELYVERQQYIAAVGVYFNYIEIYPSSELNFRYHLRLIAILQDSGFNGQALKKKEHFIRAYRSDSNATVNLKEKGQDDLRQALRTQYEDVTANYLVSAERTGEPRDYILAAEWYQEYLEVFKDDKEASKIHFLLAKMRLKAGQLGLAISELEETAYSYPTHSFSVEAGYTALMTYQRLIEESSSDTEKLKIQFRHSMLMYSRSFPEDKYALTASFFSAELFFNARKYDKVIDILSSLIEKPSIAILMKYNALVLRAFSYHKTEQYAAAEEDYDAALSIERNVVQKEKDLKKNLAEVIYQQGMQERELGAHYLAAAHFLRVQKRFPGTETAMTGLYDAAVEYVVLKEWRAVINTLEDFQRKYPDNKRWEKGISEKLALAYHEGEELDKAAVQLVNLSSLSSGSEQREILQLAARSFLDNGEKDKAIKVYEKLVKLFPEPISQAIELQYEIAQHYQENNNLKPYRHWLGEVIKTDANSGKNRSTRSMQLAAMSILEISKPQHENFRKMRLTLPLKKSLYRKKRVMSQLLKNYNKVVSLNIEGISTEATYRVAELYSDFAKALLDSQRPRQLSQEELEEYNYLLEDQAYPFEEKAIALYERNLKQMKHGGQDQSITSSLEKLGELLPYRYGKHEVIGPYVR
ncbi:MAG: tetratricopeptide repeat protein [Gammaproteobacteria bacterium]|nr:tetratricopeptide repeat protein [Gammaproteobacteria bacterium]